MLYVPAIHVCAPIIQGTLQVYVNLLPMLYLLRYHYTANEKLVW